MVLSGSQISFSVNWIYTLVTGIKDLGIYIQQADLVTTPADEVYFIAPFFVEFAAKFFWDLEN